MSHQNTATATQNAYGTAAEQLRPIMARAVAEGRWRLAADLANALCGLTATAAAADRHDRARGDMFGPARAVEVPLIRPPMRDEQPAGQQYADVSRPGGPPKYVPTSAVTLQFTRPPADAVSHAPSTCAEIVERNGSRRMCSAPIAHHTGDFGKGGYRPIAAGWYHLDPEITDHAAKRL